MKHGGKDKYSINEMVTNKLLKSKSEVKEING